MEHPPPSSKSRLVLLDEVNELDEIVNMAERGESKVESATAIADLLGGIIVFCQSEALKYGLLLEQVLDLIMGSNETKFGSRRQPIYDENGKFLRDVTIGSRTRRSRERLARSTQSNP